MALLLIFDHDNTHVDPEKERRGSYKKGYVVEVFEDGKPCVDVPAEPFVILRVTGVTKAQVEHYMSSWIRAVDYSVISRSVPQDGWRLEIKAMNASVSGIGHLTRAMVENFIVDWGGAVVNFVNNGIRFDISVFKAATSKQFWGRNVSPIAFTEVSYDQATGAHRISANYGGVAMPPNMSLANFEKMFADAVESHGGAVVSNSSPVIVFDIQRDTVIEVFREDVKRSVQQVVCRREKYVDPAFVDTIIAEGRVKVVSAAEILPYVKSRLDE